VKIDKTIIDEIIRRIDIIELISEYITLKQSGKNHKGLCPFHNEKTPSFSVSNEGFYHCFGCGESGNAIKFLQKYLNLSFVEALVFLGNRCGVEVHAQPTETTKENQIRTIYQIAQEYYSNLLFQPVGDEAYEYFIQRNIAPETMKQFGLGYSPDKFDSLYNDLKRRGFSAELLIESKIVNYKNSKFYDFFRARAMFPIKDFLGRTIAFGGRQLGNNKLAGKYINSSESPIYDKKSILFGLFEAKNEARKLNEIYIVEGYIDVISLWQAGIKNVVAPCGTALTFEQLRYLKKHTNVQTVYFLFDGDIAGQNAALRGIAPALEIGFDLRIIVLPDGKDPDTLINQEEGLVEFENYKKHYLSFVDFISKKLISEGALKTPAEKSEAIKIMLSLIWKIKDKAQHVFYIDNIREIFNYPKDAMMELYYASNPEITSKSKDKNITELKTNTSNKKYVDLTNNLAPEEKIIFKFAVKNAENFAVLIKKYNISENIFITDFAKLLFETLYEYWDSNDLLQELLQSEYVPENISSAVSQLKIENIEESSNWKKFSDQDNFNKISDEDAVETALYKLRIKNIDEELKNIRLSLKAGDVSLMNQWQKLISEKQYILDNKLRYE